MGRDKYFYHYTDPKGAKAIEKAGKINKAHVAAFGPGVYGTGLPPSTSTKKLVQNNYLGAPGRQPYVKEAIAIPLKNLPGVERVHTHDNRDIFLHPKSIDLDKACSKGGCKLIKR